jgi:hypothetical protein
VIRRRISTEVLDELDKCVLLCSECHGILHGQNGEFEGNSKGEFSDGTVVEQSLKGQVVFEVDPSTNDVKSFHLFSKPGSTFITFHVLIGDGKPQIYSGNDLEKDGVLPNLLLSTKTQGTLEIRDIHGRRMLSARKKDDQSFQLEFDIRFSPMKCMLTDEAGEAFTWVRNGMLIPKEGDISRKARFNLTLTYPTPSESNSSETS